MSDTFVVVDGDAVGMSAASKAKREAPETNVDLAYAPPFSSVRDSIVTVSKVPGGRLE